MESLAMIDEKFWIGKKVLITGCTGFKGTWLSIWLSEMGADVYGYALNPSTTPSMFDVLNMQDKINFKQGDIRNYTEFNDYLNLVNPEVVFHLAAQPLVRYSYANPIETYHTNVLGLVHVLESIRLNQSVKVIINVTSDKCYDNKEWHWGYRENEPMGGYDPYSNSKGCAELVTSCYRNSYFNISEFKRTHNTLLASCRAGNVIGGGDWADDRIIPDIIRAFSAQKKVIIRSPNAIRPWQHVLEPLSGYILLAEELYHEKTELAEGWNFGPNEDSTKNVEYIINKLSELWGTADAWELDKNHNLHEANHLKLDCSKARDLLKWSPKWGLDYTLKKLVEWYKMYQDDKSKLYNITSDQIKEYMESL